jgi:hypothetical protein
MHTIIDIDKNTEITVRESVSPEVSLEIAFCTPLGAGRGVIRIEGDEQIKRLALVFQSEYQARQLAKIPKSAGVKLEKL